MTRVLHGGGKKYMPHTDAELREMLRAVGVSDVEELFDRAVPPALRLGRALDVPPALDEMSLRAHLRALAGQNADPARAVSFVGAGFYVHPAPASVDTIVRRGEFFTAYTPYQPEVAQGTLQAIFEFQSMVARLMGLEVANASMYDGASSTAEAALMAMRVTGREKVVLSAALHPYYRDTIATYLDGGHGRLETVAFDGASGATDATALAQALDGQTAAIVVQSPNYLGVIEALPGLAAAAHDRGALCVVAVPEALSLALLRAPGACGADIATGEGMAFGIGPQYGGPALGLFGCSSKHVRAMPGRLCGETVDAEGRRGYVLTLSTREQHIRRGKATSNICTNAGLMMLAATVYLEVMGRRGLEAVARLSHARARTLRDKLAAAGFAARFAGPVFDELTVRVPRAAEVHAALAEQGIFAGVTLEGVEGPADLRDCLVLCATEANDEAQIDRLVAALAKEAGR
jgi:glycine dehydrogenase subunit 1